MPKISSKCQITLPVESLEQAGLKPGDDVAIEADGPDRIVVTRAERNPARGLGVFDGLYEPGYLTRLRGEERAGQSLRPSTPPQAREASGSA